MRPAERYEMGARTYTDRYLASRRLLIGEIKAEGRISGTVIPTPEEEAQGILQEVPQLLQIVNDPNADPQDVINANAKIIRLQELQRELGDGQNGNTPS